jgi:dipeptidyl aminopeptidase/acylaminoacyl peptidase
LYYYFADNYRWSSAFNLALMSGGMLGELHRWLAPLRDIDADSGAGAEAWAKAWGSMAGEQEARAAQDLADGNRRSAGARYLRASVYHHSGERQIPPGPEKTAGYQASLDAFTKAAELMPLNVERIEVPSPDGILPGFLIPAKTEQPAPVVIFYGGFDVTKELLYCFVEEEFVKRGITCLVMDAPGYGEPLRLRNVASRPDYEVTTGAVIDYLETRSDLDADRVGVMGISLGGYYAPRSAIFEPRVKACVAWGGIWDWGKTWEKRWGTRSRTVSVPWFQLPWVMGTDTMEEGLERVKQWTLVDALPKMTTPFLMLHGENDRQVAVEDARKAFAASGSKDKTLRIFTVAEGGAEHCQTDEPDPARQLIADWFGRRLGTLP